MCDFKEEKMNSSILVFLFLLVLLPGFQSAVVAQTAAPPGYTKFSYRNLSPPMAIIIVVLIAALFFMAFFSIYIRHCSQSGAGGSVRQALSLRRRNAAAHGLDAEVIETFPTFSYAEVKDHHMGKDALECAVCLNEFEDYETLRLIPKCDHVFHPECIDAWLEGHVTCPVCRAELAPQTDEPPAQPSELSREPEAENQQQQNGDVSIHIASEEEQQPETQQVEEEDGSVRSREDGLVKPDVNRNIGRNMTNRSPRAFSIRRSRVFREFKSHSTGHSLGGPGENMSRSRYTLLLPEEFRKELMNRASLNPIAQGENSSRGARSSYQRIEPSESDRWVFTMTPPFISKVTSTISPKVGAENIEGSTSRGLKTAVRKASFKCLEPKGDDEDGLVSIVPVRPPV